MNFVKIFNIIAALQAAVEVAKTIKDIVKPKKVETEVTKVTEDK